MMGVRPIPRVRDALHGRLRAEGFAGTCLLPEWICQSLADEVVAAGWRPDFYAVVPFGTGACPLGMDREDLQRCLALARQRANRPLMVVLAHPLGYRDPALRALCGEGDRARENLRPHQVFLDLSQGYGAELGEEEVVWTQAAYLSMNGRKLIDKGGALELFGNGAAVDGAALDLWRMRCRRAAEAQKLEADVAHAESRRVSGLALPDVPLWRASSISAHRTCVCLHRDHHAAARRDLTVFGYGQEVHPRPQGERHSPSSAYQSWADNAYLLFPRKRENTAQQSGHGAENGSARL